MTWQKALIAAATMVTLSVGACGSSEDEPNSSSGGTGGSGGGEGGTPTTTKLDILLMVDNSLSMADKQSLLSLAVPRLLSRLIAPQPDPKTGELPLQPVTDLHIGVISSSLGGHGGSECDASNPSFEPMQNDLGHLLPSVRSGLTSHEGLGFLAWNPGAGAGSNPGKLATEFSSHVNAVGEKGCGFEAQLEAWYRFLVDPSPPAVVLVSPKNSQAEPVGVDSLLLEQRRDFLRPDSAVVIIMLSDENDCSIVDGGYSWVAAQTTNPDNSSFHLARATSTCNVLPDSECCRSCASSETAPPPGCPDLDSDPECKKGTWDDAGDHPNLRCWQQKRRFGMEFLYPTRKYAEALTQRRICPKWDASGPVGCTSQTRVENPLFSGAQAEPRPKELVFLVGIVGVPWQDLATEATSSHPGVLELSSAAALAAAGRWDWLIPRCKVTAANAELLQPTGLAEGADEICHRWDLSDAPDDPFMLESTAPRSGKNPATGIALEPPSAAMGASAINGHEWVTQQGDLQYACILPLPAPRDCATTSGECDCTDVAEGYTQNNPLCQGASGYSQVQTHAKAFPGVRQLQVLHDVGDQAVVASICAKDTSDTASTAYGYYAAMDLLARSLAPILKVP